MVKILSTQFKYQIKITLFLSRLMPIKVLIALRLMLINKLLLEELIKFQLKDQKNLKLPLLMKIMKLSLLMKIMKSNNHLNLRTETFLNHQTKKHQFQEFKLLQNHLKTIEEKIVKIVLIIKIDYKLILKMKMLKLLSLMLKEEMERVLFIQYKFLIMKMQFMLKFKPIKVLIVLKNSLKRKLFLMLLNNQQLKDHKNKILLKKKL